MSAVYKSKLAQICYTKHLINKRVIISGGDVCMYV